MSRDPQLRQLDEAEAGARSFPRTPEVSGDHHPDTSGTTRPSPQHLEEEHMSNDLLTRVLEVHGGLDNWSRVTELTVQLSLGGPFWDWEGWPDVYAGQTVHLDPHRERITFEPFTRPGRVSMLDVEPGSWERVEIRDDEGRLVEARENPCASFPPYVVETPWDAIQVAYFASAATWSYLTTPFVFTYPDVRTEDRAVEGGRADLTRRPGRPGNPD